MSYTICYPQLNGKKESLSWRLPVLTVCAFFLFLFLVNTFWPEGANALRNWILPGDAAVTVMALEELAQDLGAGEALGSALENFCKTVVNEADLDLR